MATDRTAMRQPSHLQPEIRVCQNGPYLVTGEVPLVEQTIVSDAEGIAVAWHEGRRHTTRATYSLCRCGQSRTTPFCDGTHARVCFDGTETARRERYDDRAEQTVGPALELMDAEDLCAGARFCHRAGGIWDLVERSDDPAARGIAVEEAGDCPSGRLEVRDERGEAIEPVLDPSIALVEDPHEGAHGPLWVRGGIAVVSADGRAYEVRNRVTLCRCGRSGNKPFCDAGHLDTGQTAESEPE